MAQVITRWTPFTTTPVIGPDTFPEDIDTRNAEMPSRMAEIDSIGQEINAVVNEVNANTQTVATNTAIATNAALMVTGTANNKGAWSLLTGALNVPASVNHNGSIWVLNQNIANVALSEPTSFNTDWTESSGVTQFELDEVKTDVSNTTTRLDSHIGLSGITAYHLLQGNLAVDNTVTTQGFNTTLYTGNGSTQSINTGIDMSTQWGNDVSEQFGGLVWLKGRNSTDINALFDTARGASKEVSSNTTDAQFNNSEMTSFNVDGFSLGTGASTPYRLNFSGTTFASWNFQTTHRVSGTTNHGKAYTCHFNPFTGFTIVKYEGSGIAGHEIPHHLGRKLGIFHIKSLTGGTQWHTGGELFSDLNLNLTEAQDGIYRVTSNDTVINQITNGGEVNASTNQYIMYGWANSYIDESNKLIGNFLATVDGNGILKLSVHTSASQLEVMWQMSKATLTTGDWDIVDYTRGNTKELNANLSNAESTITANSLVTTASPATYPRATDTSNLQVQNAIIPFANGVDSNGTKITTLSKNETFSGVTFTAGKNYPYYDNAGAKGSSAVMPNYGVTNPANGGDFYDVITNKWYTSAGTEITESRNYLNHIVYADNDGSPLYVEELPKVEYKDIVKANEFKGKNACTAWVNFDGTTTPPTIKDSYNVSSVVRAATGSYDIYFLVPMDNANYSVIPSTSVSSNWSSKASTSTLSIYKATIAISSTNYNSYVPFNEVQVCVEIKGGKN